MTRTAKTEVRWMIRADMPSVLEIEKASFEYPWTEDDFIKCLRQRNCIGRVVDRGKDCAGFMVYELHKKLIEVLNFAVAPDHRRTGVGEAMVDTLKGKLSMQRRKAVSLPIRETNLPALQFFRSQGFRAIGILHDHYEETTEDAYVMEYALDSRREVVTNRIADRAW